MHRFSVSFLFAAVAFCQLPPVPPEFQDLFAEMQLDIDTFDSYIDGSWDGTKHPVLFTAEMETANSGVGTGLLMPGHNDVVALELSRLKALGLKAVTLSIHFPLLYAPYYPDQAEFRQYLAFYKSLASNIHARGLKLIVETQVQFPGPSTGGDALTAYYQSLTWSQWIQGRADTAWTIATYLKPDYLTVISEPDTEADLGGKLQLETVGGITSLVRAAANRVRQANVPGLRIGAGMGTWHRLYLDLTHSLCANTSIDYMNIHIYPINLDFLDRALEITNVASTYGKTTGVGEAWLYKVRESEFGLGLSPFTIFARDPFNFWSPVDVDFLRMFVKLSHYKKFDFASPFWSRYFFAYLEYNDTTKNLSETELDSLSRQTAEAAMWAGAFSSTGAAYSAYVTH